MNFFPKVSVPLLIVFFWAYTSLASAADEAASIRALISHEFDRPGAAVTSDPIVIEQKFAVADWVQGEKGGRALLHKQDGKWAITLCAGDEIRTAEHMVEAGVPRKVADSLSSKLSHAEGSVLPARLKQFGLFKAEERAANEHAGHH